MNRKLSSIWPMGQSVDISLLLRMAMSIENLRDSVLVEGGIRSWRCLGWIGLVGLAEQGYEDRVDDPDEFGP